MILESIKTPDDLKKLDSFQLTVLCQEIRSFLIRNVSKTGGHVASNLGVVELTVAIDRVFDTSVDRLVFDVGHQCYVHKMLTGRMEQFSTLRQFEGLSGFPKPYESIHDAFIAGHASNSVSVALGMARARTLQNKKYNVITVIGDGAFGGGMSYEGLNDAGASGEPMIVILNDNGMSIRQNVGGMSNQLSKLRTNREYYRFKNNYRNALSRNKAGQLIHNAGHELKSVLKQTILPSSTIFEKMGFTYLGPVDGHDVELLSSMLEAARDLNCPVVLHVKTVKGKGYAPAEENPSLFHGIGPFDPQTGKVLGASAKSYSAVFGEELLRFADEDPRICAISAGMLDGTGLNAFSEKYPTRTFDVGIAEEHAVAMAAGLATAGMLPVFAVYSTFLQRSYDMLMHDIALSGAHVVFAVDRAGLVGADGETHHGVMDIGFLSQVPGMTVLTPADFAELRSLLHRAIYEINGPVAVRYPRGGEERFREDTSSRVSSVIRDGSDATIVCYGSMVNRALDAADLLAEEGISVRILKYNRICPLSDAEYEPAVHDTNDTMMILEECVENGCFGQRISQKMEENSIVKKNFILKNIGARSVSQGKTDLLYQSIGLDGHGIASALREKINGK